MGPKTPSSASEMTNVALDPTELTLGIRNYLSTGSGFGAVSKARYSDFLVHEVDVSGHVARLTDLSGEVTISGNCAVRHALNDDNISASMPPQTASDSHSGKASDTAVKRKREDYEEDPQGSTNQSAHSCDSETTAVQDQLRGEMLDLLQRTCTNGAGHLQPMLQFALTEESNVEMKFFEIPLLPSASKEDRKQWHTLFRSEPLSLHILTDTHKRPVDKEVGDDASCNEQYVIRLWHKDFEKEMPNYSKYDRTNKRRKHDRAPRDMPYLQFVLYKENMETAVALQQLQRRFGSFKGGRGGRGRGGRGRHNASNRLRIGYAGMKDKRGVTCQFVTVPSSTSISALTDLNKPNAYTEGQQGGGHTQTSGVALLRVGNFVYTKNELRLGRLKGNHFNVILRNIRVERPLSEEGPVDNETVSSVVEQSARDLKEHGFVNYFGTQRFGKYHDTHLVGIAVLQGNFERAINIILGPKPENGERENVRSVRLAWEKRFDGVEGDDKKSEAERDAAEKFLRECGKFLNNERAICHSLASHPLDYQRAFSCVSKTMRMMFIHAFQSLLWNQLATYRIENMSEEKRHRVLVGDLVLLNEQEGNEPSNKSWEQSVPEVHVVQEDDQDRYSLDDVVLPMVGKNTVVPAYGQQMLDELLSKHSLTFKSLEEFSDKDFSCPGDYRKVLCRPSQVDYELLYYNDPLEPLVQTDLMKHEKIQLRCSSQDHDTSSSGLIGLRIGFTLPSSSYATICLRELLKRPTSSEFQSGLKLDVTSEDDGHEDSKTETCSTTE